jgi:transposase-like protein
MEAKTRTTRLYDEAFRREVISEYLRGGISIRELNRKHGILQHSAITDWMRQLGYSDSNPLPKKAKFEISPLEISMATSEKTNLELQKEINALRRKLEDEKLRSEAYLRIIQKAEEELKISIKKKPATK